MQMACAMRETTHEKWQKKWAKWQQQQLQLQQQRRKKKKRKNAIID